MNKFVDAYTVAYMQSVWNMIVCVHCIQASVGFLCKLLHISTFELTVCTENIK